MTYSSLFTPLCRRLSRAAALVLFGLTLPTSATAQPHTRSVHRGGTYSLPVDVWQAIHEAAYTYGVPADFIAAIIQEESGFHPLALSNKGAMGMMQLMPETAWHFGVRNPFEPRENILAGTRYISQLLFRYRGNATLALAAYSAGAGAVDHHHGVPPYSETLGYIDKITYLYQTHHLHELHALAQVYVPQPMLTSAAPPMLTSAAPSIPSAHLGRLHARSKETPHVPPESSIAHSTRSIAQ